MIELVQGNLLKADVDALVNTVNTVGVMGKGIALMFKEAFAENFRQYAAACKDGEVRTGKMFVTETGSMLGPRLIINFPTKQHWRGRTKLEWIDEGLQDLHRVIVERQIRSIAIPPLGAGNGGLDWEVVKPRILEALSDLQDVRVLVYEPTNRYQNVSKRKGVEKLTPARALIAELVRRYWVLGIECTVLEVQKLAWFLGRKIEERGLDDPLRLEFSANRYGPYADKLRHLLDSLDGSYLRCSKRLGDAGPLDVIWFEDSRADKVRAYLKSSAKDYLGALEDTGALIDGFESPLGMELLATVDWLMAREDLRPDLDEIRVGISTWGGGADAAARKMKLFDERLLRLAIERLSASAPEALAGTGGPSAG